MSQQQRGIRPPTNYRGGIQRPGSGIRPPTQYQIGPTQRPGSWVPDNIRPRLQPPPGFVSSLSSPSRVRSTSSAGNVCPTTPPGRRQNAQSNRGRRQFRPPSYQPRSIPLDSPEPSCPTTPTGPDRRERVCPRPAYAPRTIDYGTPPPLPYRPNLSDIAEDPQGEYCTPPRRQNEAPPRVYPWNMERQPSPNTSNPFAEYNIDDSVPEVFHNKMSAMPGYIDVFTPPRPELEPLLDGVDDFDEYMNTPTRNQMRALKYATQIRDKKYDEMKDHVADICGPRISMPSAGAAAKVFDVHVTPPNRREVQRPRDSCVPAFSEFKLVNQPSQNMAGCLAVQANRPKQKLFTVGGPQRPPMRHSQMPEEWPQHFPPAVQRPEPSMGFCERYRNVAPPPSYRFKSPPKRGQGYNQHIPERSDTPKIHRKKTRPPLNKPLRDAPKLQDDYIDYVYEDAVAKLRQQKELEITRDRERERRRHEEKQARKQEAKNKKLTQKQREDEQARYFGVCDERKRREAEGSPASREANRKYQEGVAQQKKMYAAMAAERKKKYAMEDAAKGRLLEEKNTEHTSVANGREMHTVTHSKTHATPDGGTVTETSSTTRPGALVNAMASAAERSLNRSRASCGSPLAKLVETVQEKLDFELPGNITADEDLKNISMPSFNSTMGSENLSNVSAPSMSFNETIGSSVGGECLNNVSAPAMSFNESMPAADECKLVDISEPSMVLNESQNSSRGGGECLQDISFPLMTFDDSRGGDNLNNVSAPSMSSPGAAACPSPQNYATPQRRSPPNKRNLFREMSPDLTLPVAFQTLASEHPFLDISMTSPERGEGTFCLPTGPRPEFQK